MHAFVLGLTAWSLLWGCRGNREGREAGDCVDGLDNDKDDLIDCADDGCFGSPDCRPE